MKRSRVLGVALAAVLTGAALGGCGSDPGAGSGKVAVVTAFYPLQFLAQQVGGNQVSVSNLTSPGQEPHDLELGLRQTAELSDADVVVYEKGFQAAVDEAVQQADPAHVVDAAGVADLQTFGEEHTQPGEGESADDLDPHFWQDPRRMSTVAAAVEKALADADPDHARTYARNLARLQGQLGDLDKAYADGLASCRVDTVVVSHDAFGYLDRYGLQIQGIAGFSPDAEPSPARIADLQDLIRSDDITTVFYETLVSPAIAETLANDVGVRAAVLDPIEGLTDATSDQDYLSLMRSNLAALEKANGCS